MTYVDPQSPLPPRVVEVRREGGSTGWFVAGIVAVVAVIAVAFMLTIGARTPVEDQIAQAQEQGRAVGVIEGAQTGAAQATIVAQQAARDASAAADSARRSTETVAANASQAAHDTADRAAASRDDTLAPSADPSIQAPPATQPQQ
jgi:predicted permease